MKKVLISLFISLLATPIFAQSSNFLTDKTVYYGVRFGLNLSTINGDEVEGSGTHPGISLGAIMGVNVSDDNPVCLETGIFYSQKGSKKNGYEVNLNYIEMPVLIKFGFELSNDLILTPLAGPYFSYGVAGTIKTPTTARETVYGTEKYHRWDMGFKLGCGAEYSRFYIEVGAQLGIANIYKNKENAINEISQRNNNFYVQVGLNL